ncbi:putative UDP-N-acetylglucosamine-peptide N-acetylglucosaminyltransferase SPINDLY-like protein, partial [Trifolium pratense]
ADEKTICLEKVSKKGGIWKDIYGTDEKKVADRVSKDQVDILIELTGHTANNKLGLMACRPAPEPDKNNFNSNVADQQEGWGYLIIAEDENLGEEWLWL